MKNILFVGLGRMGSNMARHLSQSQRYSVSVSNRSQQKVDDWLAQYEGHAHASEQRYDIIILCVGKDEDVRDLLTGQRQLLKQLMPGGCVIDHTTTSAELAKQMSEVAQAQGVEFLDAPVSGGEAGAIDGNLSCMVGGEGHALENVADLLTLYCSNVVHIGASGAGQIAKMANQIAVAGILSGLSEAITLVQKEGVDAGNVFAAISGGAAQSWQMDNRFETMLKGEFDFGFAVDHMIKDLGYALELAEQQGWQPEVSSMVKDWYKNLSAAGGSTQDTSSLIKHYQT